MRTYALPGGRARAIVSQRTARLCRLHHPRAPRLFVSAVDQQEISLESNAGVAPAKEAISQLPKKEYVKRMVAVHVGYVGSQYYGQSMQQRPSNTLGSRASAVGVAIKDIPIYQ